MNLYYWYYHMIHSYYLLLWYLRHILRLRRYNRQSARFDNLRACRFGHSENSASCRNGYARGERGGNESSFVDFRYFPSGGCRSVCARSDCGKDDIRRAFRRRARNFYKSCEDNVHIGNNPARFANFVRVSYGIRPTAFGDACELAVRGAARVSRRGGFEIYFAWDKRRGFGRKLRLFCCKPFEFLLYYKGRRHE